MVLGGGDCILMYHGTPRRDAGALARQLACIGLLFDVVPLREMMTPKKGLRRRVALTFDDGLKSNVEVAYPILQRLGLTATFFVCPGLVERGAWLWNHEARQRLLSLRDGEFDELAKALGGPADVEAFVEWMKGLKLAGRRRVEDAIRAATPRFSPSAAQREEFDLAEWGSLRRLDPRVVELGSHTLSHPILTSLSPNEVEREVRDSRYALESRLNRPVSLFCYPNGNLDEAALASARRHYRSAVTVESGSLGGDVDPHRLPRYSAHPRGSLRLARRMAGF
jgi:peptidoglycan/xylan/chitin deacetylase (PgdA/CDA1 family)